MSLAPELKVLGKIKWQLFCTLTFRGAEPSQPRGWRDVQAWLGSVSALARVPFSRLDWAVREERGEKFGRLHFHVLIARIPSEIARAESLRFCVKSAWKRGFADVRRWLPGLGALEYIGEDGGNAYEGKKFSHATNLILSESLRDMVRTGDTGDRRGVKQCENPRGEAQLCYIAGMHQLNPDIRRSSRSLGHILAAKASKTRCNIYHAAAITGVLKSSRDGRSLRFSGPA